MPQLQTLSNLDTNFRLKQVYAHDNQIVCVCAPPWPGSWSCLTRTHVCRTLKDSLQHCKFLNTLIVSNNDITDLKETIADLEGFQYLHELGTASCYRV